MGVHMFVCLFVCGGLMEIQTPAPISIKFCTHPLLFKEGFGASLTPAPLSRLGMGLGGLKP